MDGLSLPEPIERGTYRYDVALKEHVDGGCLYRKPFLSQNIVLVQLLIEHMNELLQK